jgi:hypothetical protein
MKTKKIKIDSLASIEKRKRQIQEELAYYEEKIKGDYFKFSHPLAFLLRKEDKYDNNVTPFEEAGSLVLKFKNIAKFAGIAFSAFNIIRSFRRK